MKKHDTIIIQKIKYNTPVGEWVVMYNIFIQINKHTENEKHTSQFLCQPHSHILALNI